MLQIAVSGPEAQDPERSSRQEWLLTNGLGGFAAGTVSGAPTRRYHGLMVAAVRPDERYMILPQLQEEVVQGAAACRLGATRYPDVWHPQGYLHLHRFTLYPAPCWIYRAASWLLSKTVVMPYGRNATVVCYRLLAAVGPVVLHLRPFLAIRDYHSVQREHKEAYRMEQVGSWQVAHGPAGTPPAFLAAGGVYTAEPAWYRRIQYAIEKARGLECEEDWYSPGVFHLELAPGDASWFWVSAAAPGGGRQGEVPPAWLADPAVAAEQAPRAAAERIDMLLAQAGRPAGAAANLVVAADAFIVRRERSASVIAGYPWFTDWGRDAMISLPGLFLATGRQEEAAGVLATFAAAERDGLIPNRFPDAGAVPEYNTVDAPLWFIYAWWKYIHHTGERRTLTELWPAVRATIAGYKRGTAFNIGVDRRGLVTAGAEGYALTWMDAKAGGWIVTPRHGAAVEINALWYNALRSAAAAAAGIDPGFARQCREWAEQTEKAFRPAFWLPDKGYLADVLAPAGEVDSSLRPNQLLAISLPFPLLAGAEARQVVQRVGQELLTPLGLRTLSPADPAYQPYYGGDQQARDAAYHQGAAWAWLMGPFISAYRQAYGRDARTLAVSRCLLAPLLDHLQAGGLGQVTEICEGTPPHVPAGCFAQAWSVAEILRLWSEEFARAPLEPNYAAFC